MRYRKRNILVMCALITGVLLASTADAEAQRRWRVRPRVARSVVHVGVGFYRPYYGFHGPYAFGPYPYDLYGAYGYDNRGAVRVQVKPEATEVYVDGYFAGVADSFDGIFQRLRLPPGGYQIELRLDGFQSFRERILLSPETTYRIRHNMVPLGPGEVTPPPPEPIEPILPPRERPDRSSDPAGRPGGVVVRPRGPAPRSAPVDASGFGALALRVQPSDAEVLIDGEPWQGPAGFQLVVELGAGTHRIEIRRDGYRRYLTEVEVRAGETATLNVSLPALD